MLAAAILTAIAATEHRRPAQPGLIPLTVIEIRRLFAKTPAVLRGMNVGSLEKTDQALEELRRKGLAD